jgi:hypothetical protein
MGMAENPRRHAQAIKEGENGESLIGKNRPITI